MQRRSYNFLWLFLALLLTGQSLLPMAGLAQVSMRCIGAPAGAKPCAQGTFALPDMGTVSQRFAGMACCRAMRNCPAMSAATIGSSHPASHFVLSSPHCRVFICLLTTKSATLGPQAHRWLLGSAPSLAPPALRSVSVSLSSSRLFAFPNAPFTLQTSLSTHSHGLRAPPFA